MTSGSRIHLLFSVISFYVCSIHAFLVDFPIPLARHQATRPCWKSYTTTGAEERISDATDKGVIKSQLGYSPTNFVRVSARTCDGDPIAIQTYPLDGGAPRRQARSAEKNSPGTPFPTLFWLTNPAISAAIAGLERKGYVKIIQEDLNEKERRALLQTHRDYARLRWESLSEEDRSFIANSPSGSVARMRNILQMSGVAGANLEYATLDNIPSIKCLHTHYAHYRSVLGDTSRDDRAELNPIGYRVHELLEKEYPELSL